MSKQVWKCEYCSTFKDTIEEIKIHENECSFNPKNKSCYTCINYEDDGFYLFGSGYICTKGFDHFEYTENSLICPEWEHQK